MARKLSVPPAAKHLCGVTPIPVGDRSVASSKRQLHHCLFERRLANALLPRRDAPFSAPPSVPKWTPRVASDSATAEHRTLNTRNSLQLILCCCTVCSYGQRLRPSSSTIAHRPLCSIASTMLLKLQIKLLF